MTNTDVKTGEVYSLQLDDEGAPVLAEFFKEQRDGTLEFHREKTDRPIEIDPDEFDRMRSDGRANRVRLDRDGKVLPENEIDPLMVLDPDEPSITVRERDRRLRLKEMFQRRRTLRFYVMRYDKDPKATKGKVGAQDVIKNAREDAMRQGFTWQPSPNTLLRAVNECGAPGNRALVNFLPDRREVRMQKRWPKEVVEAAVRAIETYWDDPTVNMGLAISTFRVEANALAREYKVLLTTDGAEEGEPDGEKDLFPIRKYDPEADAEVSGRKEPKTGYPIPCDETVRLWIHQNADWWHWARRYGVANANRRFEGRGRPIEAKRPLEFVMFDHTMLDVWAVVEDEDGMPLFVARPWLTVAVDCYSRMVLGAVIGFEPPSIHSVIRCLRQVVRRKDFLLDRYGEWKGASDGWGRPFTVIVDNGKEFVSPSFQASCEAAGIDVIWAPVKMPTFKAYVERLFETFNTMVWHDLPGGLPLTPQQRQQLDLEPEGDAVFSRSQLDQVMWNAIVTRYHVNTHKGIDMAPALKWARGIAIHKRATVDNVALLDAIIGKSKMAQLSAEGVTIEGHRFHDPDTTTMLMNRLVKYGKERRQRKGVTSSRTVPVRVTWDEGDASRAYVWDPETRSSVMLPNWDKAFSEGLTWFAARKIKEWAEERNQAFHSDEEKAAARVAFREFVYDVMPGIKAVDRQRRARLIEPQPELVPGDRVVVAKVQPGSDNDLPHDTAARRAERDMRVKKGKPFGGKAGARKAAATRRKNREAANGEMSAPGDGKSHKSPSLPTPETPMVDIEAIRKRIAAKKNSNGKSTGA